MKKIGVICILAAGILWGCTGYFVRVLSEIGFNSLQMVTIRLSLAALCFISMAFIRGIRKIKVSKKHLPLLFSTGFFGVFSLSVTYLLSMQASSLSLAAILMYTAPIFVMLASLFLFKEKMTTLKVLSLILASVGLVFVSGILKGDANVTFMGVVWGILSGITYGSYSIFGKYVLKHYDSYILTVWAFITAGFCSLFVSDIPDIFIKISTNAQWYHVVLILVMGFVTAFLPFLLYSYGLSKLNATNAIILASVEPLVASLVGIFIFKEATDLFSVIGIFIILAAVVLASLKAESK